MLLRGRPASAGLINRALAMTFKSAPALAAVLFLAAVAAVTLPARATTLAEIKAKGEIIVGVKDTDPPFGWRDESGELVGMEPDLARDLAAQLGVTLKLFPVTAVTRLQFLQAGMVDAVIATMAVTPHREKEAELVQPPYFASRLAVLTLPDGAPVPLASLNGKRICTLLSAYYNAELTSRAPNITLALFRSPLDAAKELAEGRCVGFVWEDVRLIHLKAEQPDLLGKYEVLETDAEPTPWVMALPAGDRNAELTTSCRAW